MPAALSPRQFLLAPQRQSVNVDTGWPGQPRLSPVSMSHLFSSGLFPNTLVLVFSGCGMIKDLAGLLAIGARSDHSRGMHANVSGGKGQPKWHAGLCKGLNFCLHLDKGWWLKSHACTSWATDDFLSVAVVLICSFLRGSHHEVLYLAVV